MAGRNWQGVISFGLVSIPISLVNSENKSQKVAFHMVDKRNNARIQYVHINAETGKKVEWENIGKAYQYNKDTLLPVNEDEINYVAGEKPRTIEIMHFIPENSIDLIDIEKTYYLIPKKEADKGYVILREALKENRKMGIAKVIISTKEYIAAVSYYKNALVLYLLRYRDEIKPLTDFNIPADDLKSVKATQKEVEIAKKLIQSMSMKWRPEKYKDEFSKIVHAWAEKKAKHKKISIVKTKTSKPTANNVVNFVDLLKQSLKNKNNKHGKKKKIA